MTNRKKQKSEPFMTGYFLCLFPAPSKASPSAWPEEGWHSIHIYSTCPWDPYLCVCVSSLHLCFRKAGSEVALPSRFSVRESETITFIMKVLEEVPAVKISCGRCVTNPVGWRLLQTVAETPDSSCFGSSAAVKCK